MFELETEQHIVEYLSILRKRKYLIILCTLFILAFASTRLYFRGDVYKSKMKVLFEYTSPGANLWQQPYYMYTQKIVPEIEENMILNSKIIGRVMKELSINAGKKNSTEWREMVANIKSYLKIKFKDSENVNVMTGSRMLAEIQAIAPQPKLAQNLLQTLVDQYQMEQQEYKIKSDMKERNWLDTQLKEAKVRIEEAEIKFQEFKQDKGILSIKELQEAHIDNFSVLEKDFNDAVRDRKNLEIELSSLDRAYRMDESTSNIIFSDTKREAITKSVEELNNYKIELKNAEKTFKAKHPKVLEIKEKMKLSRQKIRQAKLDVIKSLKIKVDSALSIEGMKELDMRNYKKTALEISNDALQYTLLEREVVTSRKLYELLAQQLKESSVRTSFNAVSIRVLEPPIFPADSQSKKYPLKLMLAAMVGFAIGVTIAFLLEYIDLSIKTPDDVKSYLGLPVVATIPMIDFQFDEGRLEELTNLMVRNYEEQSTTTV